MSNNTGHDINADALSHLSSVVTDYRLARSFWGAALTIVLYDFFLTLGDEITYMWTGKLTRTRVLFFINRYWAITNLIFDNIFLALESPGDRGWANRCFFFFNWFVYSPFVMHLTIGAVLILRIYAMYNCSKPLLWTLCALLALEIVSETVMVGFVAVRLRNARLPPPINGCVPTHIVPWVWAYWVPMSVFESVLFLLAVAKALRLAYYQDRDRAFIKRRGRALFRFKDWSFFRSRKDSHGKHQYGSYADGESKASGGDNDDDAAAGGAGRRRQRDRDRARDAERETYGEREKNSDRYGRAPNLLVVLLRDSVVYFGGVLAVILTNLVVWNVGRPSLFSTFPGTAFAVHSILGCRMLLNIQRAVHKGGHDLTVLSTLDTMDFSGPYPTRATETDCVECTRIVSELPNHEPDPCRHNRSQHTHRLDPDSDHDMDCKCADCCDGNKTRMETRAQSPARDEEARLAIWEVPATASGSLPASPLVGGSFPVVGVGTR